MGWARHALTGLLAAWPLALSAQAVDDGRAAAGTPATSVEIPVEVSRFTTLDTSMRLDRIVSGDYDEQFLPIDGSGVHLRGDSAYTHWLKLSARLPDAAPAQGPWVLHVQRVPLERFVLYLPRSGRPLEMSHRFFQPAPGIPAFAGFDFTLPPQDGGIVELYAAVVTRADVTLSPSLMDTEAFHGLDRGATAMLSAVYAAILVLALGSLSMWTALHDRAYLYFVGFTASLLLLLAAGNGHAYAVPGLAMLAWWGPLGIHALTFLTAALSLGLTQRFVELDRLAPRADRAVTFARYALLGLAVLSLLNVQALTVRLQHASTLAWLLSALAALVISTHAWRRGRPLARVYGLIWLLMAIAIGARWLLSLGWIEPGFKAEHGAQLVLATAAFLLSIGLAERVMEFRKQRDRARLAKDQTDASLQVEQQRRELVEGLRESLRTAPPGDLEWIAFRKLLVALEPLVPQQASAVIAYGYHDLDLLIAEPAELKQRFSLLMAARGGNIKGICRGRTPLQVMLEYGTEGGGDGDGEGMFAIVPLQVARPGWGAVIVERPAWEEFQPAELKLIIEFAQITVAAADEAAGQADLRRRAELDPLTGAFNRRAGDAELENLLGQALDRRLPLSVMFLDLDHFKQVNDRHGHATGDECLRQTADAIRRQLQPGDLLARYGGEEFLVLLPGRQPDQARQIAERMREAISQLRIRNEKGIVKLTASVGVAGRGGAEETPQPLLERADRALYTAKRNGRNQVQVAPSYGGYGSGADDEPPEGLVL